LVYIDRVCWRLPDTIRVEGGLDLHLDRNPFDPYFERLSKWRPIQTFVTLTDHFGPESGGLKVVKGFHNISNDYFGEIKDKDASTGGEFYRMNSKSHAKLHKKSEAVYAPKGSLVCWDNRLPHATCDKLSGFDTREVVYTGFLPNVELNKKYIANQLLALRKNIIPPAYSNNDNKKKCDKNWNELELTLDQKNRLGIL